MKKILTTYFLVSLAVAVLLVGIVYYYRKSSEGFEGSVDSFTLYYADWCPHCKTVKPEFEKFSQSGSMKINGKTVFLSMVEAEKNPEKAKGKPVRGYPTLLLETADGKFKEYDGERSADGWSSWLKANV